MKDDLIKVPGEGALRQQIPEGSGSCGDRGEPRLWSPVRTISVDVSGSRSMDLHPA